MKVVYYPFQNLPKPIGKAVVTIGIFDGMHRGHLILLKKVLEYAHRIRGNSVVISFWPHPQKERLIFSIFKRLELFKELGIDFCILVRFDRKIANMSAEEFFKDIVLRLTSPEYLIVGENFRFGKGARADAHILKEISLKYNFSLKIISPLRSDNRIISSTYIRKLILKGNIREANRWLYSPFSIYGEVVRGERIASQLLGYPTANLKIENKLLPPSGVYLVRIKFLDKNLAGLCYIGNKPTFKANQKSSQEISIEVHILNFKSSLYEKTLEIEFIARLRPQRKFPTPSSLSQAISRDIQTARRFFNQQH